MHTNFLFFVRLLNFISICESEKNYNLYSKILYPYHKLTNSPKLKKNRLYQNIVDKIHVLLIKKGVNLT